MDRKNFRNNEVKDVHRLRYICRHVFVGIVIVFLLGGCSILDRFLGEKEEKRPSELMSDGMRSFERGNYKDATEAFQKLKDRYPYSRYAIIAELRMADALYEREEFEDAYTAYDEFEKLHPKNKNISYVIYQKGMSNFRQLTTIDRDQTFALKAKEEFERLIRRFPRDEYAKRARKNLRRCLIYLAEYELYVGHYYFKMGKYRAAMDRYIHLVQNYPDMGRYHEALEYISKCKEKLNKENLSEKEGREKKSGILRRIWPF